jgi:hypothetical protein
MLAWIAYSAASLSPELSNCHCPCCENDEPAPEPIFSLSAFHSVFALASIYMLMMVTHWAQGGDESVAWAMDRGRIGQWVNFAASWLTEILYLWTLIAPAVCPDRDFS